MFLWVEEDAWRQNDDSAQFLIILEIITSQFSILGWRTISLPCNATWQILLFTLSLVQRVHTMHWVLRWKRLRTLAFQYTKEFWMYVCMYIFRTRNMSDSIKMIKLCDQNLKFHFWYTLPDTFDLNARLLWY